MENIITNFQSASDTTKLQILDQISTPIIAVDKELRITYINNSAQKILSKKQEDILGKNCNNLFTSPHCNTEECCISKTIDISKPCSSRNEITIDGLKIPVEYFCVPLKDESNTIIGGLVSIIDKTERVQYEEKLKEERLREQRRTIREMSTPTIQLWEGVLVLPILGFIDSTRAQHMMDSILNKIMETYSKITIMDIHGVAAIDTDVANHLIKITKATKLMGCQCILSGITPAVAQTIIQLGIDMEHINTKPTLSDALAEAFSMLHLEVKNTKDF